MLRHEYRLLVQEIPVPTSNANIINSHLLTIEKKKLRAKSRKMGNIEIYLNILNRKRFCKRFIN